MRAISLVAFKTVLVIACLGCAGQQGNDGATLAASAPKDVAPKKTMRAFRSEQELAAYFKELAEKQKNGYLRANGSSTAELSAAPQAAKSAVAGAANEDSVTNVQHAGVDEGGIVKVHGNHLVVLRRGRLFTVAIG